MSLPRPPVPTFDGFSMAIFRIRCRLSWLMTPVCGIATWKNGWMIPLFLPSQFLYRRADPYRSLTGRLFQMFPRKWRSAQLLLRSA